MCPLNFRFFYISIKSVGFIFITFHILLLCSVLISVCVGRGRCKILFEALFGKNKYSTSSFNHRWLWIEVAYFFIFIYYLMIQFLSIKSQIFRGERFLTETMLRNNPSIIYKQTTALRILRNRLEIIGERIKCLYEQETTDENELKTQTTLAIWYPRTKGNLKIWHCHWECDSHAKSFSLSCPLSRQLSTTARN